VAVSSDPYRAKFDDEDEVETLDRLSPGRTGDIAPEVSEGPSVDGCVGGHNIQILGGVDGDVVVIGDVYRTRGHDQAPGQPVELDTRSRYRATIQKIFARCPDPVDRALELEQIADFLSRDEPYYWWIGEPYCGKTTLAAAIAAAPPPDVVSTVSAVPAYRTSGRP